MRQWQAGGCVGVAGTTRRHIDPNDTNVEERTEIVVALVPCHLVLVPVGKHVPVSIVVAWVRAVLEHLSAIRIVVIPHMRNDSAVLHRGDERTAVCIAVVQIRSGLVVVLHEVRERQIAHPVLNGNARRREHPVFPRTLFGWDVEAGPVVPSVVVPVVIHVPRIQRVGRPVILGRDVVHSVGCIAILPSIGDTVAVGIRMCWVGDATQTSIEIFIVQ